MWVHILPACTDEQLTWIYTKGLFKFSLTFQEKVINVKKASPCAWQTKQKENKQTTVAPKPQITIIKNITDGVGIKHNRARGCVNNLTLVPDVSIGRNQQNTVLSYTARCKCSCLDGGCAAATQRCSLNHMYSFIFPWKLCGNTTKPRVWSCQ